MDPFESFFLSFLFPSLPLFPVLILLGCLFPDLFSSKVLFFFFFFSDLFGNSLFGMRSSKLSFFQCDFSWVPASVVS